jgi:aspartyl protease family protein
MTALRARSTALLCIVLVLGAIFGISANAYADPGRLRDVLKNLSRQHGFSISGLHRITEDVKSTGASGALRERLYKLLKGYNYVLVHRQKGGVESLLIAGRKVARGERPETVVIATQRRGAHHVVEAQLISRTGSRLTVPLIVDTGASTIVLPLSMASELGFDLNSLVPVDMRTANGVVSMLRGELWAVQVADLRVSNVAVTFVDDAKAGFVRLLGMSFLKGFRVVLDDKSARLMLIRDVE